MKKTISFRAYAEHRRTRGLPGNSLASVQKAIRGGRIALDADGKIEADAADEAWARNTHPRRHKAATEQAAPEQPPPLTSAVVVTARLHGTAGSEALVRIASVLGLSSEQTDLAFAVLHAWLAAVLGDATMLQCGPGGPQVDYGPMAHIKLTKAAERRTDKLLARVHAALGMEGE